MNKYETQTSLTQMITREQILTMQLFRLRGDNVFSPMPQEIIQMISNIGLDPDVNGDTAQLLKHVAYGNLVAAKAMLDINPKLIVMSSNTVTPSGHIVRCVTPYECALGAGDPEMAKMIAKYFDQFTNGSEEKERQDAKYRLHLESMLKQTPFDFTSLLNALIKAQPEEVYAALNNTLTQGDLYDELEKFRKELTPGKITVGMHFNYQHLLRALEVYGLEWDHLFTHGKVDFSKHRLFCCQVIGFIQRSLPAIDRMVYAQCLYYIVGSKSQVNRSFKFEQDVIDFPVTAGLNSHADLGFDFYVGHGSRAGMVGGHLLGGRGAAQPWKTYVEEKLQACRDCATAVSSPDRLQNPRF